MGRWFVAHCPLTGTGCKKTTTQICCVQNRAEAKKKLTNHVTTGHYHMMPWSEAELVVEKHEHTAITVQEWTSDEDNSAGCNPKSAGCNPPLMTNVKLEHEQDDSEVASEADLARHAAKRRRSPSASPAAKRRRSRSASVNIEDALASIRRAEMAIRHAANIARNAVLAFDAEADTLRNIRESM